MPLNSGAFEREPLTLRAKLIWVFAGLAAFVVIGLGVLHGMNAARLTLIAETQQLDATPTLEVTANGMISIRGTRRADFEVIWEGQGGLLQPTAEVQTNGEATSLDFYCGGFFAQLLSCIGGFEIEVPAGTNIVVNGSIGQVRVADIAGSVDLASTLGRVDAVRTSGYLSINTTVGAARVWDGRGSSQLSTIDGGVIVRGSRGDISAVTQSGNFFAERVAANIAVQTASGAVVVQTDGQPVAFDAVSTQGRIFVAAPTDLEADHSVYVRTSWGPITLADENTALSTLCPFC
jgi:DUF4097 and DUF4098 domain-containing protein YvlB